MWNSGFRISCCGTWRTALPYSSAAGLSACSLRCWLCSSSRSSSSSSSVAAAGVEKLLLLCGFCCCCVCPCTLYSCAAVQEGSFLRWFSLAAAFFLFFLLFSAVYVHRKHPCVCRATAAAARAAVPAASCALLSLASAHL